MTPGVSAGSNHVGASVTVAASVTWPAGAATWADTDDPSSVSTRATTGASDER